MCAKTVNLCNKASNRIVSKQKDLVVFFWITLSHEVSRYSPYNHICELPEPSTYLLHINKYPSIMDNYFNFCCIRDSSNKLLIPAIIKDLICQGSDILSNNLSKVLNNDLTYFAIICQCIYIQQLPRDYHQCICYTQIDIK